ncbi:amidohydrolase family protein [Kriegella sp. EG-1]|nr:amidohydrolase family protein [Flavobacteriaceae bacterium EG-1]
MKIIRLCLLILFSQILYTSCSKKTIEGDLVITNVNVIDVEKGMTNSYQTVAIKKGQIVSISKHSSSDNINSDSIIDGSGKFLMPALWDMHVHYTTSEEHKGFLNLFITNGVLGVRDLWGNLKSRDYIDSTNVLAPEIYLSGAIIDGPFTLLNGSLQPRNKEEAIILVDSLHKAGADFIKVYDDLSQDIYSAIAKRCKELDMPFVGHVPLSVKATKASEMGQKSMEHLNGIWKSSTNDVAEIDSLETAFKSHFLSNDIESAIKTFTNINSKFNSEFNKETVVKLAKKLKENKTYVTPTLITIDRNWSRIDGTYKNQDNNKYVPESLLQEWDPELNFPSKMYPVETWNIGKELLNTSLKITKILHDNGVPILAGTDCGVAYVIPGFSLHDELELFTKAGLSNSDALKTATINPAMYFNLEHNSGKVAIAMNANLLLLDKNPLLDISNTQTISGIIKDGEYLNRKKLDELLENAIYKN